MLSISNLLLLSLSVAVVWAHSHPRLYQSESESHPYIHNGPDGNGLRAPCPGLNSLANHGHIARDGRGIEREPLIQAMVQVYHLSESVAKTLTDSAFSICNKGQRNNVTGAEYINLDCLQTPSKIGSGLEHDVSLSRLDCPHHDCVRPDPARIADLESYANEASELEVSDIIAYRRHVECDISRSDPDFQFPLKARTIAAAEAAVLTAAIGRFGPVPVSYIRPFFLEERLPYEEGWTRPDSEIAFTSFRFAGILARYTAAETTRRC